MTVRRILALTVLSVLLAHASPLRAAAGKAEPLDANLGTWNLVVLLFLGLGAAAFFVSFAVNLARGGTAGVESHWGGFGGGLGGWQISSALAYLVAALVLSILLTLVAISWMSPPRPAEKTEDSSPTSASTTAPPAPKPAAVPVPAR